MRPNVGWGGGGGGGGADADRKTVGFNIIIMVHLFLSMILLSSA